MILFFYCPLHNISIFMDQNNNQNTQQQKCRVLSIMPKFPGISVETQMEHFGPGGNFPEKVVHLKRWSSLTSRSGPTETCRSIFEKFSFPVPLH